MIEADIEIDLTVTNRDTDEQRALTEREKGLRDSFGYKTTASAAFSDSRHRFLWQCCQSETG